jgi:Mrp family chromosome partitioning ATPase
VDNTVEICATPHEKHVLRIVNNTRVLASAKPRTSAISHQLRSELDKLVQRLFLSPDRGVSVAVFSAMEHGNGCSWTCARTAEMLANRTDRMVCLIDANFRSPNAYAEFEFQEPGRPADDEWTFAPVRNAEAIETNLWVLSYKPASRECPAVSSLRGFEMRVADLRHDFTYVLIDAPPLSEYADAAVFGRMADGLVMVLEANTTRREAARKAKQLLDDCGVSVLGAVLNKRMFPIPERVYRRL